MNTISKLCKNFDVIFIIGGVGSGKTTIANKIELPKMIYDDVHFLTEYKSGKIESEIINKIISARHVKEKIIICFNGLIKPEFSINKYENFAWIFTSFGAEYHHYYDRYLSDAPTKKLTIAYIYSITRKRKTKPYLFVSKYKNHFGRFKK